MIFRHFPLNIPAHDKAILAAKVVEAANLQDKGIQMLDMVLANQKNWTADPRAKIIFLGYATKLGLDLRLFRKDLESDSAFYRIANDIALAQNLKLNSTPSVFLNGKMITFAEAENIEEKIAELIKQEPREISRPSMAAYFGAL
jgi:protein-disulfide isomerase